MPKIKVNDITMNYDKQGTGEPMVLIPYLATDYACYAFQVAEYVKHFTCISVDLRGAGETDKPEGHYSTELFAEDVGCLHAGLGCGTRPRLRPLLGSGNRDVACGQVSSQGEIVITP